MSTHWPGWILRAREDRPHISYLELLFDLGLIVALAQISRRLSADLTWYNAAQTLVLLGAIWWVWTVTAYTTDWYEPELPVVQVIVLGVLLGGLLMAMAVPDAYQGHNGFTFAGAYVGLHVFRGLVLITALRGHQLRRRSLRVLLWFVFSGVLWLTGATQSGGTRLALWAVALVIDYSAGLVGYRVPGLGRTSPEDLRIVGEHVSERYRQMFVVALGELLLIGTLRAGSLQDPFYGTAGVLLMFASTVALWRLYLVDVGRHLARGIERSPNPGVTALVAAYAHLMMVSGVALTAASSELLLEDPHGTTSATEIVVFLGGPLLVLVGLSMYTVQSFHVMPWRQPLGIGLLLGLAPAAGKLPALAVVALVKAILLFIAFVPVRLPPRAGPEKRQA